jgi:hypothetical protein
MYVFKSYSLEIHSVRLVRKLVCHDLGILWNPSILSSWATILDFLFERQAFSIFSLIHPWNAETFEIE